MSLSSVTDVLDSMSIYSSLTNSCTLFNLNKDMNISNLSTKVFVEVKPKSQSASGREKREGMDVWAVERVGLENQN